ncbi:GNAT family N-acetyltransferase [Neptuniibacter halophilus]|uniref:GNAT family N-acetyltransferase n=1 Tax=Neptuniibacter halophilus TaxID=651666 RepID=UPI003305C34E
MASGGVSPEISAETRYGKLRDLTFHYGPGAELTTPALGRFYKRNGHKGKIQPDDRCFWLSDAEGNIIAAARISEYPEQGYALLRGVWVDKNLRGNGLGKQLMTSVLTLHSGSPQGLYCLSYSASRDFYTGLGFTRCTQDECPEPLYRRWRNYHQRGNPTHLMQLRQR